MPLTFTLLQLQKSLADVLAGILQRNKTNIDIEVEQEQGLEKYINNDIIHTDVQMISI